MKRLNLKTNQPFKQGDINEQRLIFRKYIKSKIDTNGYFKELWITKDAFDKEKLDTHNRRNVKRSTKEGFVKKALELIRWRANKKQVPFDLDTEYLLNISVDKCPVFQTPLHWGIGNTEKMSQPSLDRIIPELGYVKGNVQWLSTTANSMKYTASNQQLHQFADWIKINIPT